MVRDRRTPRMSERKAARSGLREFRRRAKADLTAGERRSTSAAKDTVEPGALPAETGTDSAKRSNETLASLPEPTIGRG